MIEETTCKPDYSNSMAEHLGIRFLPSTEDTVHAEMPVDHRTSQPFGMLNGGASLALAEIVAGHGSMSLCREDEYACGVQVSGNHLSAVPVGGKVFATGKLIHRGRSSHIWNIDISQVNDVYMYIDKTQETEETIKEIKLENFVVNKTPEKGNIKLLRPTGELSNLYTYSEQDYLNSDITYQGGVIDDMKSLEIANNGGILGFRFLINDLGKYISNENEEIIYDGNLLKNLGINLEQIQFSVSFDIIITTSDDIGYKGTVNIDMPIDSIIEEGSSHKEITDFSNVVFKRI